MGLHQSMGIKKMEDWICSDGTNEPYETVTGFDWCKHARLQEFMTQLHMKKNNIEPSVVNGKQSNKRWVKIGGHLYPHQFGTMKLTLDDLDKLEKAIKNGYKDYECDGGFFWGDDYQEESVEEYKKRDLDAVEHCRIEIKNGKEVFYYESW